jgi:hypothetical protein
LDQLVRVLERACVDNHRLTLEEHRILLQDVSRNEVAGVLLLLLLALRRFGNGRLGGLVRSGLGIFHTGIL